MEPRKRLVPQILTQVQSSSPTKKDYHLETILLSDNTRPLTGWTKFVKNGYVKRMNDEDVLGKVIELRGNPDMVYIATPEKFGDSLNLNRRWLSLIVKSIAKEHFKFQVQCLDTTGIKRVFRFDTRCTHSKVQYYFADIPFMWKMGWNNLDVDLKMLMRKAYCTDLSEVVRVHVHANCRLKRIFLGDVFLGDDGVPLEFKLISAYKDFRPRAVK